MINIYEILIYSSTIPTIYLIYYLFNLCRKYNSIVNDEIVEKYKDI